MHKWHVNAALGRGRPLRDVAKVTDSIALSLRQFHISALRAQDEETSSSQPPTYRPRRERLQNTTQEIQNLFNRSTARSRPAPSAPRSDISYRSIKLDPSASPGPGFAVDARSLPSKPSNGPRPLSAVPALRNRPRTGNSVRGDRASGRGGKSARGGRGGRDRDDREPRRRKAMDGEAEKKEEVTVRYTEAEEKYLRDKRLEASGPGEPYQVQGVSQESLMGDGPAVAVGEFGMSELVEERLRLLARKSMMEGMAGREDVIRRVLAGEFVRFDNEQEKQEVLAEAERISKREAELRSEEKGEIVEPKPIEFVGLEEAERKAVVEGLLKGQYTIEGEGEGAEGILGHLMRSTSRNETYLPKDGSVLLEKVRTLLPVQKSRPAAKAEAVN